MHKRNTTDRGFSLMELLILLAATAILAGLSIPMLTSAMRDMQLNADGRKIAAKLTYAKVSAMSQLTHYRMSFDVAKNQWTLEKFDRAEDKYKLQEATNSLSEGMSNSGIFLRQSPKSGIAAPTGFQDTSSSTITFNSRGRPTPGPDIIYLSNQDQDYAVTVSTSGKVQLLRNVGGTWKGQ